LRTRIGELFGIGPVVPGGTAAATGPEARAEAGARMRGAFEAGGREHAALFFGQDSGLIDAIEPAGAVGERIMRDAEVILGRLAGVGR
jgi:hypothetical protein